FLSDLVDSLDLSTIYDTYTEERGYPPYHPLLMVKILLYGYARGIFSSRKLARAFRKTSRFGCSAPATSRTSARSRTSGSGNLSTEWGQLQLDGSPPAFQRWTVRRSTPSSRAMAATGSPCSR